jgi:uncharacterized membrane protein
MQITRDKAIMIVQKAGIYLCRKRNTLNPQIKKPNKMKQIILIFVVLFVVLESSRAQDSIRNIAPGPSFKLYKTAPPAKFSYEYYIVKSNKFKTTGWVLAGLGTVLGVTGLIIYENHLHQEYTWDELGDEIANSAGAELLMIAGSTMVLVSIPVFITSLHYKKKALNMSASLKLESYHEIYQTGITQNHYPALGITIRL